MSTQQSQRAKLNSCNRFEVVARHWPEHRNSSMSPALSTSTNLLSMIILLDVPHARVSLDTDSLGSVRAALLTLRFLAPVARSAGFVCGKCARANHRVGPAISTRLRCAQGSLVAFKGSIRFREILRITTIWGICFRSNSNPGTSNR
jgi:hypothetical protein